jgi:hypothetical protein
LIEYNLVQDTMGYNMQIKWQKPRPNVAGMPTTPQKTIIRHNVFIKTASRDSPDGDRPNVLLGGFPDIGAGSQDLYEVYGNLFYYNPRESLIQASGRVSIHDNIFVGGNPQAIRMQDHDLPLQLAHIYNNTIYTYGSGIVFGSRAREWDAVIGNLIFAATSTRGSIRNLWGNLAVPFAFASDYVAAPSMTLESMNFFPLKGKCRGAALDLTAFADEDDFERDFNGSPKGKKTIRGAYAGEGMNPGWKLKDDIKVR